jgi:AraC-like DNA-binding protein
VLPALHKKSGESRRMVTYTYPVINSLVDLQKDFARIINIPCEDNYFEFPSWYSKGYYYAADINEDISFLVIDNNLNEDFHIICDQSANKFGLLIIFDQLDVTSYMRYVTCGQDIVLSHRRTTSVYLSYTHQKYELFISKGTHGKRVSILIKLDAIKHLVKSDALLAMQLYIEKGIINNNPNIMNDKLQSLLNEIFEMNKKDVPAKLILENRILMLLEMFFNTLLLKETKLSTTSKEDIEKLKAIEQKLKSDSLEEFPSVEALSKMAMMSATKLKKKFKEIYGMKLYEYYNRYRLDKAKKMIQSKNCTIKEVAYSIGYSNIGNFSRAFKKEFGVFPSSLKEKHHI